MKIHEQTHSNVTTGSRKKIKIEFETNAVAFFATFSGVASDKIGYPVRELSTNAWDAARGNFEVHLPTSLNPIFRVRDFGPGMSEDDMENVYARPYASKKRDDNNSVGGWGIGSKSPYAYLINDQGAGSYNVTSYHGGMMRSYEMSMGSDGMPAMDEIFAAETDAPSGMEISFAVKREDISTFVDRVRTILWSFHPRPNVFPEMAWAEPEVLESGEGWTQYDSKAPFYGPHVRMGCVMYPINLDKIQTSGFLQVSDVLLFEAPIGSLKPTLSREDLAYDEKTRQTLEGLVRTYEASVIDQVQAAVSASESYFTAAKAFDDATATYGNRADALRLKVTWRGMGIADMIGTDFTKTIYKTMTTREGWSFVDKFSGHAVRSSSVADAVIVMEHSPHYSIARLAQADLVGKKILWIRCKRYNRERVLVQFGNPEVITLDDYKVSVERMEYSKTIRKRKVLQATGESVHREVVGVDLSQGGYYVWLSGSYGRHRRREEYDVGEGLRTISGSFLDATIKTAIQLGVLDPCTIVVQRGKDKPLPDNWVMIGEDLIDGLSTKVSHINDVLRKKSFNNVPGAVRVFVDKINVDNAPASVKALHADAKALCDTLRDVKYVETDSDKAIAALARLGKDVEAQDESTCPIDLIEKRYVELTDETYPLMGTVLKSASSYYGYAKEQVNLDHYFDLLTRSGAALATETTVAANDDEAPADDADAYEEPVAVAA